MVSTWRTGKYPDYRKESDHAVVTDVLPLGEDRVDTLYIEILHKF